MFISQRSEGEQLLRLKHEIKPNSFTPGDNTAVVSPSTLGLLCVLHGDKEELQKKEEEDEDEDGVAWGWGSPQRAGDVMGTLFPFYGAFPKDWETEK